MCKHYNNRYAPVSRFSEKAKKDGAPCPTHHPSTLKVDRCYKELVRLPLRYDDIKRVEVKFLLGTVIILLAFKAVLVEHTSLDGDGFSRP